MLVPIVVIVLGCVVIVGGVFIVWREARVRHHHWVLTLRGRQLTGWVAVVGGILILVLGVMLKLV